MKIFKKTIVSLIIGFAFVLILYSGTETIAHASEVGVKYRTHIQYDGWTDYSSNGAISGSVGQGLRLEAIEMFIDNNPNLNIRYSTHIQDIGWEEYAEKGEISGTYGQSKRLEAIKIELLGTDSEHYDVFYRVHAQNIGWLGWTKNGYAAGTENYGYRLEAIEVKVVKKGAATPELSTSSFISNSKSEFVRYSSHVENMGWLKDAYDGGLSGTEGLSRRMEAIRISLSSYLPSGSIKYSAHVQNIGWMNEVADGELSGTENESKRIEAVKIRLEGTVEKYYGVEYRTHVQNNGWTDWKRDGEISGSTGEALRLEAIEVRIYLKPEIPYEEPTPEPVQELDYSMYTVNANLNLRATPSASGKLLTTMAKGSTVKVFEIVDSWAKVEFQGLQGYAASSWMQFAYDVYKEPIPMVLELNGMKDTYVKENISGSGIALAYDGIRNIRALLDGNEITISRYEDTTLRDRYPDYPKTESGGYSFEIDYNLISAGDHTITLIAESNYRNTITKKYNFNLEKNQPLVTINGMKSGDSVPTGEVTISGVALSDSGVKEVKYYINGIHEGNAQIGLPSDTSPYPQYANSSNAGYSFSLNPALMNKAANALKVELVGNDGSIEYTSIVIKGASTDTYVVDPFPESLKYYVDLEYVNTQKYIGSGTAIWNKVKVNMDPGNFIYDDINKFIFLDLSYNESDFTVTAEELDKMLAGRGILSGQGQTFLDAAKASKINPFYLVAHSLLETGNGTSILANGQKIEVVYSVFGEINSPTTPVPEEDKDKLVYNVFGIGAWDINPNLWGAQKAYAKENRWFTVEEAITGGATWISSNYIHRAKPQNTLYRMRFNIAGNMTHQYATDIEWAKKQAARIKKQFDDMGVTAPKRFIVPTFVNP